MPENINISVIVPAVDPVNITVQKQVTNISIELQQPVQQEVVIDFRNQGPKGDAANGSVDGGIIY